MNIDTQVRALLAKTIKVGATPGEQAAAAAKARELVAKHGLDAKAFTWPAEPRPVRKAPKPASKPRQAPKAAAAPTKRATRPQQLCALLSRKAGVSIDEIVDAFGVQPHAARAMVSIERSKGLKVERRDGRYHVRT